MMAEMSRDGTNNELKDNQEPHKIDFEIAEIKKNFENVEGVMNDVKECELKNTAESEVNVDNTENEIVKNETILQEGIKENMYLELANNIREKIKSKENSVENTENEIVKSEIILQEEKKENIYFELDNNNRETIISIENSVEKLPCLENNSLKIKSREGSVEKIKSREISVEKILIPENRGLKITSRESSVEKVPSRESSIEKLKSQENSVEKTHILSASDKEIKNLNNSKNDIRSRESSIKNTHEAAHELRKDMIEGIIEETKVNENYEDISQISQDVDGRVARKRKRMSMQYRGKTKDIKIGDSPVGRPSLSKKNDIVSFDNTEWQKYINFKEAGDVYVIGQGDAGQIGLGEELQEVNLPTKVNLNGVKIKEIVCGAMHTLLLTKNGKVLSCGCNDERALGRESTAEDEYLFGEISFPKDEIILKICAGDSFSAALTQNGKVFAWGLFRDSNGPIGLSDSSIKYGPALIYHNDSDVCSNIVSGSNHLLILTCHGRVYSCGGGDEGQLGRISERNVLSRGGRRSITTLVAPKEVFFPLGSKKPRKCDFSKCVVRIFSAKNSSFAQMLDGSVYGWGLNNEGQIDPELDRYVFYPVFLPHFVALCSEENPLVIKIVGGINHLLVLNEITHKIYSAGRSLEGALGRPDSTNNPSLQPVNLNSVMFLDCACGDSCSFAISNKNELFSWGLGCNQQLGFEDDKDVFVPTIVNAPILKNKKVIKVSSGSQHTAFLCLE